MRLDHYEQTENDEDPDRWLISYADFITLLMAFFVVMYAMSSVQEKKYHTLKQSVREALGSTDHNDSFNISPATVLPATSVEPHLASAIQAQPIRRPASEIAPKLSLSNEFQVITEDLEKSLAPLIESQTLKVIRSTNGLNIEVNASILFPPASADLQTDSKGTLARIAKILNGYDYFIHVAGHTDNIAISNKNFPSNWELSSSRASQVVRFFELQGIPSNKLIATGYADTRPATSNENEQGRMRNRRVEISLKKWDFVEPMTKSDATPQL